MREFSVPASFSVGERDNVVCSRIPDREAILGSIKEFLGTGR